MKTIARIATFLILFGYTKAAELVTPTNWLVELGKVPDSEKLTFVNKHRLDWPVLRSPSWIERQLPNVKAEHRDDKPLALVALELAHGLASKNFAGYENAKPALAAVLLEIADTCKIKGGHNNNVIALAYEKLAIHLALSQIISQPADARLFATWFLADKGKHIKTKDWLKQRGEEDAWLHDKMPRIDTITETDEATPFGVFFRLAQGAEVPAPPPFSYKSLIENSNVVRLLFDAVNVEYSRTVALPLVIDFIAAGGVILPRPANPVEAVRDKLGKDMSKYYHKALRQGNASANDIWSTLNQMVNEPDERAALVRWLE